MTQAAPPDSGLSTWRAGGVPRGTAQGLERQLDAASREAHFHELHHGGRRGHWRLATPLGPSGACLLQGDVSCGLTGAAVGKARAGRVRGLHRQALAHSQGGRLTEEEKVEGMDGHRVWLGSVPNEVAASRELQV